MARDPAKPNNPRAPTKQWSKYASIWRGTPAVNYSYGRQSRGYGSYGRSYGGYGGSKW
jgi:hypothetical protein